jgi:hypothetical protein
VKVPTALPAGVYGISALLLVFWGFIPWPGLSPRRCAKAKHAGSVEEDPFHSMKATCGGWAACPSRWRQVCCSLRGVEEMEGENEHGERRAKIPLLIMNA